MKKNGLPGQMPKDKNDAQSALAIVKLGYPAVAPLMKDMLLWLRVYESPVADIFAQFFAELTPRPVALIAKHIGTQSEILTNRILVGVLNEWPQDALQQLSSNLTDLAMRADMSNNDIECFKLILKHELADKAWVKQWLDFRKGQAVDRVKLFEELEKAAE